jgi:hypothetical protein
MGSGFTLVLHCLLPPLVISFLLSLFDSPLVHLVFYVFMMSLIHTPGDFPFCLL